MTYNLFMKNHQLTYLSPLDGRYAKITAPLRAHFSEFAFIRARARIEIDYLIALSEKLRVVRPFNAQELSWLHAEKDDFSLKNAERVKEIERETRHDVKAIEYFLREEMQKTSLADTVSWLHFGLTSADVNFTALGLELRNARDLILLPAVDNLLASLTALAKKTSATPILARTHGQPAVPSIFGKEIAVFIARLQKQREKIAAHRFEAKFSGAVGNYNAHLAAFPKIDWIQFNRDFFDELGLAANILATQILPYDNWLAFFQHIQLLNNILLDFAQDMWRYISDDYLKLRVVEGEIGSSTMPQKVNPIDFENAEGNLGLANALFEQFIRKLSISRLQRDLSDSTVRRNFGAAFGYCLVAYQSLSQGLSRVEANQAKMESDLEAHWEVIAEGAQTILRAAQIPNSYELLKILTRGKKLNEKSYLAWVEKLDVEEAIKEKLRRLSPKSYIGAAQQIAEAVLAQ